MAPEVLAGMPADHRADLFSLGVVILDVHLPPAIVTRALDASKPEAFEVALRSLPAALRAVTDELHLRDPERRHATASDVIEALARDSGTAFPIETSEGIRSALRSIGMVGRKTELDEIVAACASYSGGAERSSVMTPSVFLLHGEAGIGKTVLLDRVSESLLHLGVPVQRDACPER